MLGFIVKTIPIILGYTVLSIFIMYNILYIYKYICFQCGVNRGACMEVPHAMASITKAGVLPTNTKCLYKIQ